MADETEDLSSMEQVSICAYDLLVIVKFLKNSWDLSI